MDKILGTMSEDDGSKFYYLQWTRFLKYGEFRKHFERNFSAGKVQT